MSSMQALLNLFACRHRNQACTSPASQQGAIKLAQAASDSESSQHSTEPGDASNAEFSDRSEPTVASRDHSDNEVPAYQFNLAPPPGLTLPTCLSYPSGRNADATSQAPGCSHPPTRLNAQAALFVPAGGTLQPPSAAPATKCQGNPKPIRQTISLLKGVLHEWEVSVDAEEAHTQEQHAFDKPKILALKEAVSRLSYQDAATLRSFLGAPGNLPSTPFGNEAPVQANMAANAMSIDAAACYYPPLATGVQYPGAFASAAVPSQLPPPGAFCYNQPEVNMPGLRMHASCSVSPSMPSSSKPRVTTKAPTQVTSKTPSIDVQSAAGDDTKDTLRTNLRDLSLADPSQVLMVRKINRLGLDSPSALEAYFSTFGTVGRVMVSHSRAKSMFGRGAARVRPAGLGFLLMTTPEGAQAALAAGSEHEIQGTTITVHPFESRSVDSARLEAEGC